MEKLKKAIEIRNQIKELEEKANKLKSELYSLQRELQPKAIYGNIKVNCEIREGRETIRISDFLLNEEEKKQHMNIFGSINGDWKECRNSVGYYRNEDGILVNEGGGWLLIQDCKLCSDKEWESIKEGNIPDKFKKGRL